MSTSFEIPHSVSASVYGSERAWNGSFQGFVGYSNGKAVTTAAAVITGDVIGLYSVATLPQHRRLGFAEAIMRQVIQEAQQTAGCHRTVLQATSSGYSLYEEMGYRTVTSFQVYIAIKRARERRTRSSHWHFRCRTSASDRRSRAG